MVLKLIRLIVGKLILFFDSAFPSRLSPAAQTRPADRQAAIDKETSRMALYEFEACPFCVKTRRALQRLGLHIEIRDARKSPAYAEELLQGGGQLQVPCLRIEEPGQKTRWMYESSDIIAWLEGRYGEAATGQLAHQTSHR